MNGLSKENHVPGSQYKTDLGLGRDSELPGCPGPGCPCHQPPWGGGRWLPPLRILLIFQSVQWDSQACWGRWCSTQAILTAFKCFYPCDQQQFRLNQGARTFGHRRAKEVGIMLIHMFWWYLISYISLQESRRRTSSWNIKDKEALFLGHCYKSNS